MNHMTIANRLTCGIIAAVLCTALPAFAQTSPTPSAEPPVAPATTPPPATKGGTLVRTAPPGAAPGPQNTGHPAGNAIAPSVPVQSGPPAIKFEPTVLDLGDMIPEVAKTGSVKVTNISDSPLHILKIQPSCGCTTTTAPPGLLAPGETTSVDITLKPPSKGGTQLNKNVTFQMEGHAPQVLTVTGFVKEYVSITPDVLSAPSSDAPAPATIRLASKDEHAFKVTGTQPEIFAALPTASGLAHDLQVDWAKWETAGKPVKVAIMTDHPKAAQLTLLVKRSINDKTLAKDVPPPTAPLSALLLAAREKNADKVKEALKSGADVEAVEPSSRRTALHFAADSGNVDIVKALLAAKANPNAADRTGRSPVTVAAEKKQAEILQLLIASGGNIELRDQLQGTPVLWAAGLGSVETVKILLDAGANPNVVDAQGMTPLIWAATIGKPEVVKLLIEKGADVSARDKMAGESALTRAVRTGSSESVKLLLEKGADLNQHNNQGMTPFLVACGSGDMVKIKMLLDKGADKTAKDSRGWGAIDFAHNRTDPGKADVLKFLEPIVPASTAVAPPQTKDAPAAPSTTTAAPATPAKGT